MYLWAEALPAELDRAHQQDSQTGGCMTDQER